MAKISNYINDFMSVASIFPDIKTSFELHADLERVEYYFCSNFCVCRNSMLSNHCYLRPVAGVLFYFIIMRHEMNFPFDNKYFIGISNSCSIFIVLIYRLRLECKSNYQKYMLTIVITIQIFILQVCSQFPSNTKNLCCHVDFRKGFNTW